MKWAIIIFIVVKGVAFLMSFKISATVSSSEHKRNILKNLHTIAFNTMTLTVYCDHVKLNRTTRRKGKKDFQQITT